METNQLVEYANHLRTNYQFNYKEILETARSLKTLDNDVLKETIRYFTLDDPDINDDSNSSQ